MSLAPIYNGRIEFINYTHQQRVAFGWHIGTEYISWTTGDAITFRIYFYKYGLKFTLWFLGKYNYKLMKYDKPAATDNGKEKGETE